MKFFKLKKSFDWKYIIREVLLIFIGINLAIWFNNWNSSNKTKQNKDIVIAKIKGEIENNIKELDTTQKSNQFIVNAFSDLQKLSNKRTSSILTNPQKVNELKKRYPHFFNISDSLKINDTIFRYNINTYIELEIPVLNQIAWETAKSIGITNEFDYECLYNLESTYNLQLRVKNEVNKAANALQKREIKSLIHILEFLEQLNAQLIKNYQDILLSIESCA
ncbi:hypothetical protein [Aquimarina mytili]|uniref:Uncharacterized protein n=1 Tax=Aquimarina mytili TaxID=874423 RepID=A0A937D7X9_9FLAO|nr:hypothetical protein [Aquimarina mytili]MBL0683530.1 hypothetical protein [Aquimarina mytili]